MITTVNEFSPGLVLPVYNPTNYDSSLEIAVASKNQANYDRVLNTVRGLQSQALNIQILNGEGRERLNTYNKELNEKLSGDLGDLNKTGIQNEVASFFQKLTGDSQLIKASQLSSQYQEQLNTIESFRGSGRKDKGYNSINETVFREWNGGLNDFMNSSLSNVTNPNFQPTKYTPFKELDTKLLNIAKTLHADTLIQEGSSGSEGYLLHKETSGVSPEKIREMMLTQFDQEDLEQLDIMAKYEIIQNRKLNTVPDFYRKYNSFADNEIKRTETQSNVQKQQADYYQSLINNKNTPEDKKAQYVEIVNQLKINSGLFANRATSLRESKKELSDFERMSNQELVEYAKEIQWYNKVNGLSNALSWKKEVETLKPDQVWMFNNNMDGMKWRENLRSATKLAVAKMAKDSRDASKKAKKESEIPQFSGVVDTVENTQSFFDSYQTLTGMQESMSRISDRVVTSPSFVSTQLLDDNFLQQNKDNYEVKMWDTFTREYPNAIKEGKPQIEAFKLWLKDKEANPEGITGQYVEEQNRNEQVSNYLDKKVMEINQATRGKVSVYDALEGYSMYKSDGSPLTKEEYNSGVPGFLGVPVDENRTGYRLVPIEDVLNEAERFSDEEVQYIKSIVGGMGTVYGAKPEPKSYITNDRGLYARILKANELKDRYNAQLEQELIGRLPQIFQNPLVEAVNDEAKLLYLPDVVGAAKNSNKGKEPVGQFAISIDDIALIRPPVTGNKGQFSLKPNLAKEYGKLGWMLPDAVDSDKMVAIVPGGSYSFFTNKPYMPYDILLNEAVKETPIKSNYKGYTIQIAKSKISPEVNVTITDPNGQSVANQSTNEIQDVSKVIKVMQQYIDSIRPKK